MRLIKIIILSFAIKMMCSNVHAHSGHDNAEDCHDGNGSLSGLTGNSKLNEGAYSLLFCNSIDGKTKTWYSYIYPDGNSHVKVDCETEDMVYEGGLDKRSSLNGVRQALFFSSLTCKKPAAAVIYDTDGEMGRFEYRIKATCEMAEVDFL